jgi:hypothetical protein
VPAAPTLAGLPDCLALLLARRVWHPARVILRDPVRPRRVAQDLVRRPRRHGLALHHGPHDALLLDAAQRVSALTGLPIVPPWATC